MILAWASPFKRIKLLSIVFHQGPLPAIGSADADGKKKKQVGFQWYKNCNIVYIWHPGYGFIEYIFNYFQVFKHPSSIIHTMLN